MTTGSRSDCAVHVVQLEFSGRSADESFAQMRAALAAGTRAVGTSVVDPISLHTSASEYTDLSTRARALIQAVGVPVKAPVVVQAECTGAALAIASAGLLSAAGRDVLLIQVFNPETVTRAHLESTYGELADRLGAPAAASRDLVRASLSGGGSPEQQLAELRGGLLTAGTAFARGLGVCEADAPAFSLELVDRYTAWLSFLRSCLEAPYPPAGTVHVYRTRPCSAITQLRACADHLVDRATDAPGSAQTVRELIRAAASDIQAASTRYPLDMERTW